MEIDNNEWKVLEQAIQTWQEEGLLTEEKAAELKQSLSLKKAGQQIAQYFFLIALSCTLIAFSAIFIDEKVLERLKQYFSLSNFVIALLMAALAAAWFVYLKKKAGDLKNIAFEFYLVLGGLAAMTSLVYLCKETGFGPSYSGFLIAATIVLCSLSVLFRSAALWIAAILSLMAWYGSFTYAHGHNHIFLGMNYPVRFTILGAFVTALSYLQARTNQFRFSARISYIAGLIIFFTGLWGVSIFGNYTNLEAWYAIRQTHVLVYGFLFGIASLIALYLGIRYRDDIARDLGILFLLINFYSRYFEYFWNAMHKGIFFLLLAASFWLVGRWIERRKKIR